MSVCGRRVLSRLWRNGLSTGCLVHACTRTWPRCVGITAKTLRAMEQDVRRCLLHAALRAVSDEKLAELVMMRHA